MMLSEVIKALDGKLLGDDVEFKSVSTDTRSLKQGDLFVAIQGPHFDAHTFIDEARIKGAVGAMVSKKVKTDLPLLLVADTRMGLGRLATTWRSRYAIPMIAVTGSNGKTTVKEMLATILGQHGPVLATRGNLNNEIGVPLTLLHLDEYHRYAVIEMGANGPGEINYLSSLVKPQVAIITNAAPAHLEGFGDISGVARAKGEIFDNLVDDGTAVINADDSRVGLWRVMVGKHHCLSFGIHNPADLTAREIQVNQYSGCSFEMHTPAGFIDISLRLPGKHNVMNALAASAGALAAELSLSEIKSGLEAVEGVKGRLQLRKGIHNTLVIDDTYNANPGSMRPVFEILAAHRGKKILVLGDMGELGNASRAYHEQVGRQARATGIDLLYTVGDQASMAAGTFGKGAHHFANQDDLILALCTELNREGDGGAMVLVKGSRFMRMEQIAQVLISGDDSLNSNASAELGGGPHGVHRAKDSWFGG
jgi:UDP-N-acetylmuramoyl-tripeptide--D-alanyl-D-alanine ligase